MKILCVAEKPSISKSVTQILSGGAFETRQTPVKWIKNYDFTYRMPPGNGHHDITMTAVTGHLTEQDFGPDCRHWNSVDPFALFDKAIHTLFRDENAKIARNLEQEARRADQLMIWTDCDREGEHIGTEIETVCRKVKPNIRVTRARFSSLIPAQIHAACRNPVNLDHRQAEAVSCRIELDLRIGAALTRFQTLSLQNRFLTLSDKVISYGPCQFPTLGFVVDQYEKVQNFIPEQFWYIYVSYDKDGHDIDFGWKRHRLFDEYAAYLVYETCVQEPEATVVNVQTKPATKWKPLPLTTVELQKSGSRLLHMTPKKVLDIAEKLYQKGFVSYPRTETDQFDKDFNFMELIEKQTTDGAWGAFATDLTNQGFQKPRNGKKNDQAHPPIHPIAHASNLDGDDKQVYEFITRRFLACCSKNATGKQTTVDIKISEEEFSTSGLVVLERNYLDVYPYDKWQGSRVPDLQIGEMFMPTVCELRPGQTSPPSLLTEADLVNLMDKNGIGTDATIAEHISRIIEREYVMKRKEGRTEYLVPSTLGIGLVEGYNQIGLEKSLSKPHLRRQTEERMGAICQGEKTKAQVLHESLDEYRDLFVRARQQLNVIIASVGAYLEPPPDANGNDAARRGQDDDSESDADSNGDGGDGPPDPPTRGNNRRGRGARGAASTRARGRGRAAKASSSRSVPNTRDDATPPKCNCDLEARLLTTKKQDSPNFGRQFWKCSKPQGEGCSFFQWVDEQGPSGRGTKRPLAETRDQGQRATRPRLEQEEDAGVRCKCDLLAAKRTSQKENENKGRTFFTCSKVSKEAQCNFFQWEDVGGMQVVTGSGNTSNYSCFKCGQAGHFASKCTQGGFTGNSRNTASEEQKCFNCGGSGHYASACDRAKNTSKSRGGFQRGRGGSSTGRGRGRGRGRRPKEPDW